MLTDHQGQHACHDLQAVQGYYTRRGEKKGESNCPAEIIMSMLKACPVCKTHAPADRGACLTCGHVFRTQFIPPLASSTPVLLPESVRKGKIPTWKTPLVVFAVLAVMAGIGSQLPDPKKTAGPTNVPAAATQPAPTQPAASYLPAGGHLWEGVRIFYGSLPDPALLGQVAAIEPRHLDQDTQTEMNEVEIERPDGSAVWMQRDTLIQGKVYWVMDQDPALLKHQ